MSVPVEIINEILSDAHGKLSELPKDDIAVRHFINRVRNLIDELNTEYVYIRYKIRLAHDWSYAKFDKEWFDLMDKDELEEEILSYPENSWVHDSWHPCSITIEKCTSDEYKKIKGF